MATQYWLPLQLLPRGAEVVAELDFDDGAEALKGPARGAAHDRGFRDGRIAHTVGPEAALQLVQEIGPKLVALRLEIDLLELEFAGLAAQFASTNEFETWSQFVLAELAGESSSFK